MGVGAKRKAEAVEDYRHLEHEPDRKKACNLRTMDYDKYMIERAKLHEGMKALTEAMSNHAADERLLAERRKVCHQNQQRLRVRILDINEDTELLKQRLRKTRRKIFDASTALWPSQLRLQELRSLLAGLNRLMRENNERVADLRELQVLEKQEDQLKRGHEAQEWVRHMFDNEMRELNERKDRLGYTSIEI